MTLLVCIKPKVWNLLPMTPIEALRYGSSPTGRFLGYRSCPSITTHAKGRKEPQLPHTKCTMTMRLKLSNLVTSLRYIDQKSPVPTRSFVQYMAQLRETTPTIVKSVANTAATPSPHRKDYKTVGKPRR